MARAWLKEQAMTWFFNMIVLTACYLWFHGFFIG